METDVRQRSRRRGSGSAPGRVRNRAAAQNTGRRHPQPVRIAAAPAASQLAESRWRPLAFVACLTALTAAGLLYADSELAGDLFWLLAAGRHVDVHGVTGTDPFLTIAHGGHWYNQQWLSEWLIFRLERLGGLQLVCLAYALLLAGALIPLAWACRRCRLGPTLVAWVL